MTHYRETDTDIVITVKSGIFYWKKVVDQIEEGVMRATQGVSKEKKWRDIH